MILLILFFYELLGTCDLQVEVLGIHNGQSVPSQHNKFPMPPNVPHATAPPSLMTRRQFLRSHFYSQSSQTPISQSVTNWLILRYSMGLITFQEASEQMWAMEGSRGLPRLLVGFLQYPPPTLPVPIHLFSELFHHLLWMPLGSGALLQASNYSKASVALGSPNSHPCG